MTTPARSSPPTKADNPLEEILTERLATLEGIKNKLKRSPDEDAADSPNRSLKQPRIGSEPSAPQNSPAEALVSPHSLHQDEDMEDADEGHNAVVEAAEACEIPSRLSNHSPVPDALQKSISQQLKPKTGLAEAVVAEANAIVTPSTVPADATVTVLVVPKAPKPEKKAASRAPQQKPRSRASPPAQSAPKHAQQQSSKVPSKSNKAVSTALNGTFTSLYRGVTCHRLTGRFEAHFWDSSYVREKAEGKKGRARGRQIYLGGYANEEDAARAYDHASLAYLGPEKAATNFDISEYSDFLASITNLDPADVVNNIRKSSVGFARGRSHYRGVTKSVHQHGKWEARVPGIDGSANYLSLGDFDTAEDAAAAYDRATVKLRGKRGITNFALSNYKSILENPGSYDVYAEAANNGGGICPGGSGGSRSKRATAAVNVAVPPLQMTTRARSAHQTPSVSAVSEYQSIESGDPAKAARHLQNQFRFRESYSSDSDEPISSDDDEDGEFGDEDYLLEASTRRRNASGPRGSEKRKPPSPPQQKSIVQPDAPEFPLFLGSEEDGGVKGRGQARGQPSRQVAGSGIGIQPQQTQHESEIAAYLDSRVVEYNAANAAASAAAAAYNAAATAASERLAAQVQLSMPTVVTQPSAWSMPPPPPPVHLPTRTQIPAWLQPSLPINPAVFEQWNAVMQGAPAQQPALQTHLDSTFGSAPRQQKPQQQRRQKQKRKRNSPKNLAVAAAAAAAAAAEATAVKEPTTASLIKEDPPLPEELISPLPAAPLSESPIEVTAAPDPAPINASSGGGISPLAASLLSPLGIEPTNSKSKGSPLDMLMAATDEDVARLWTALQQKNLTEIQKVVGAMAPPALPRGPAESAPGSNDGQHAQHVHHDDVWNALNWLESLELPQLAGSSAVDAQKVAAAVAAAQNGGEDAATEEDKIESPVYH